MKAIVVSVILASVWTSCAMGQYFVFVAGDTTGGRIQYTTDNGSTLTRFPVSDPASLPGYGDLTIAFMGAPNGTPLTLDDGHPSFSADWTQIAKITKIGPTPGKTVPTFISFPASIGPARGYDELSIVAWTGTATTWQEAVNGGATMLGWTGSSLSGGSLEWSQPVDNIYASPVPDVPIETVASADGLTGYNGIVLAPAIPPIIPEPSTFALGFAGAACLIFSRSKKRLR